MRRTLWLTLLVPALVLAACEREPVPPLPGNTVGAVLEAEGFTVLARAIAAAGLEEALAGTGPFTIFAPTDEAFGALPPGALDELLADPTALAELLRYHVLPEELTAAALLGAAPGFRTTLQGAPLALTLEGEGDAAALKLNGVSTVTETDIEADNGVIHEIDSVLRLPLGEFSATLAGASQVPPVESDATGDVTATLDGTTLTVSGSYEGLTVAGPGAHIHGPATVEQNAPVLFPLDFDNAAGTLTATVDLAAAENAAFGAAAFGYLQSGRLYANLHTEANPEGEIRGQLLAAAEVPADADFTAVLSGAEQVPPVETEAQGSASASFDEAGTTLTVTGSYTGLSSPLAPVGGSAGHIHVGARGENGPVVVPLTLTPDAADPTRGTFSGSATIGEEDGQLSLETLTGGGYYLNIHTEDHPSGEIRGQLTPVETEPN